MLGLPTWSIFAGVFAVAFGVTWALVPVTIRLSHRLGTIDVAGGRRRHQGAIPRLGGLAIFGGFMVATLLTLPYPRLPADTFRLAGLLLGCTAVTIGGLFDDRLQFSALPQIAIVLVASAIAIRYWVFIERVNNPLTNEQVVFPLPLIILFTLLWMAGMTTTINWLDGLDGLATAVSAIAVLVFFVHMLRTGQQSVALLPAALLGATLGFLPHNWTPARVFLGSAGAYFLGFAVGGLSLIGGARAATALLVLGIPIVDVAWQILDRVRHGRSPAAGDRGHLHFRLLDQGMPQARIVLLYCAVCALLGGLALLLPSRLYKLFALLTMAAVGGLSLARLARAGERSHGDPGSPH
ncbi:MAG: undecaprenyl/decaprenyl-phosphate alpha-N-acetylglucosaminyl 1-phosphate transferase [Anaerolineae bacterium]|nr:undecaprenyl/decaprenyl-phosphate alpha-N-acetylglucosaminyl 1-phosphate transferase [Anaerolineae bacterium]